MLLLILLLMLLFWEILLRFYHSNHCLLLLKHCPAEFIPLNKTSQVTYVTMVPRVGNETLRPLGVATGNASSVTRVWRYICKNTIRWPATAHDVTTGATIIKGSPGEYIISFFVWSLRPKHGPKPRGRSVSFPTRGTMVTYVTWDVPLHGNSNFVP